MKFDNEIFRRYPNVFIKKLNETYRIKELNFYLVFGKRQSFRIQRVQIISIDTILVKLPRIK